MRIQSPFRDYYDAIMRNGMDGLINFHRVTEESDIIILRAGAACIESLMWGLAGSVYSHVQEHSVVKHKTLGRVRVELSYVPIIVCGKPHLRWIVRCVPVSDTYTRVRNPTIFHDIKSTWEAAVQSAYTWLEMDIPKRTRRGWQGDEVDLDQVFKGTAFIDELNRIDWDEIHRAQRTPILALRPLTHEESRKLAPMRGDSPFYLIRNPNLGDLRFQEVMDPFTIFQELSMYISGVMGQPSNPTVELTDADLRNKHGFDPKYGFRTRPHEAE